MLLDFGAGYSGFPDVFRRAAPPSISVLSAMFALPLRDLSQCFDLRPQAGLSNFGGR
jgi:hypothetical protein